MSVRHIYDMFKKSFSQMSVRHISHMFVTLLSKDAHSFELPATFTDWQEVRCVINLQPIYVKCDIFTLLFSNLTLLYVYFT